MTGFGNFVGAAKRLKDIDIARVSLKIPGTTEDHIHAILDVEAAGSGFDYLGRPKALFEPHWFYRLLRGRARDAAIRQGLAYPKWGMKKYPKDSYHRIHSAMAIDQRAALEATSWGLGQILGVNHKMLGYSSPEYMVEAFMEDEENHLEGIVDFIIAQGIDDDLAREDWRSVARVYNGPKYYVRGYHIKLAERYAWWLKLPNTPYDGEADVPFFTTSAPRITESLQSALKSLGFPYLEVDGIYGPKTKQAVAKFQARKRLRVDGIAGDKTWAAILAAMKT